MTGQRGAFGGALGAGAALWEKRACRAGEPPHRLVLSLLERVPRPAAAHAVRRAALRVPLAGSAAGPDRAARPARGRAALLAALRGLPGAAAGLAPLGGSRRAGGRATARAGPARGRTAAALRGGRCGRSGRAVRRRRAAARAHRRPALHQELTRLCARAVGGLERELRSASCPG